MVNVSMIVGCFGIAPTISSFCTRAAAFAPLPADCAGAELTADGASEVPEFVWLWGVDSVLDWEEGASGVSVGCVIVGTDTTGASTGVTVVETADVTGLIGLTGDITFVGFVSDFTQESELVAHAPNNGLP